MSKDKSKQTDQDEAPDSQQPDRNNGKPSPIIEQDANDIPYKGHSQVPNKNPHVQPGHRDREEI
jgi:hypothetical protein